MDELKQKVEMIRNCAIRASVEPDEWPRVDDAIQNLQLYINNEATHGPERARLVVERVRQMIIRDMLLSFVCSMAGGTTPITTNAIASFFTVDKKWVGPEDESCAFDLMIASRYDMVERLNGFNYLEMIQFIIGMRYYISKNGLVLSLDDVRSFHVELLNYLSRGALMETDEHWRGVFVDIEKLFNDTGLPLALADDIIIHMLDAAVRYIRITCNSIIKSTYNHNSIGNREYAVKLFESQLNDVVRKAFIEAYSKNTIKYDIKPIDIIPVRMGPHRHSENPQHDVMTPICDILIRMIMYSVIINEDKMGNCSVINSVFDAVIIRREIDNERTNIEYQNSTRGQNLQDRRTVQRVRTKYSYIGENPIW